MMNKEIFNEIINMFDDFISKCDEYLQHIQNKDVNKVEIINFPISLKKKLENLVVSYSLEFEKELIDNGVDETIEVILLNCEMYEENISHTRLNVEWMTNFLEKTKKRCQTIISQLKETYPDY